MHTASSLQSLRAQGQTSRAVAAFEDAFAWEYSHPAAVARRPRVVDRPPHEAPTFSERHECDVLWWVLSQRCRAGKLLPAVRACSTWTARYPTVSTAVECALKLTEAFPDGAADKDARQFFQTAVALEPNAPLLNFAAAQNALRAGDAAASLELFGRSCRQPDCPNGQLSALLIPALYGPSGLEHLPQWVPPGVATAVPGEFGHRLLPQAFDGVVSPAVVSGLYHGLAYRSPYWDGIRANNPDLTNFFSYWMPASSGDKPHNLIEQVAFRLRELLPAGVQARVAGVEYWAKLHTKSGSSGGHQLHFDEDWVYYSRTGTHAYPM